MEDIPMTPIERLEEDYKRIIKSLYERVESLETQLTYQIEVARPAAIAQAVEAEREACCEAIRVACPACGGSGVCVTGGVEYVTRDMALDACEPAMEGMPIYQDTVECEYCGQPIAAIRARRQP